MSYNILRDKLDRAIVAYLITAGVGSRVDTFPANNRDPKPYPNTVVKSALSKPEVYMTGLRRISVHISIKGSATQNLQDPNSKVAITNFNKRVADTYDAMMQTDDGQTLQETAEAITKAGRALAVDASGGLDPVQVQFAANNADMVDFTCQAVYDMGEGDGEASESGCSWENILLFDVIASPSNVD